jgi:hypothetical protein
MSFEPPQTPPEWSQPVRKPGMSTGVKVLIILAIVFGVLAVLCCGGIAGLVWWAKSMVSNDSAVVVATTREITDIDIPAPLKPLAKVDVKITLSGQSMMVMVVYDDKGSNSSLVLVSMGEAFGSQNQKQMRQSIDQSLQQQGMGNREDTLVSQTSQKELTIRGEKAVFTIGQGKGANSQKPRIQVTGAFQGKKGPAMLILEADAEKIPEEEAIRMLESIK